MVTGMESVSELCSLIETASRAGAFRLKFKDLEVQFGQELMSPSAQAGAGDESPESADSASEQKEIDPEDTQLLRERKVAEMVMTDPLAYEEMLVSEGIDMVGAEEHDNQAVE